MEKFFEFIPWIAMVVILGGSALVAWRKSVAQQRRRQQWIDQAKELGLTYQEVLPPELDGVRHALPLLNCGSNRRSGNVIVASTDQLSLILFDHQYTSGSGKNRSTHRQSVAWVYSGSLNLPTFYVAPETWLSWLGDQLFKRDIDFDDDTEFSSRIALSGPDRDAVSHFFDRSRRQKLLAIDLPTIEATTNGFLFYRPGKLIAPESLKSLMNEAFTLYQAFASDQTS